MEMSSEHSVMQYFFTFAAQALTHRQCFCNNKRIWKFNCCNRSKYIYIIIGASVSIIHAFRYILTGINVVRMYSHVQILQLKEIRQVSIQLVIKVLL